MTLHVFVGYDVREHAAWLVCKDSILRPYDVDRDEDDDFELPDIEVHALSHRELRRNLDFDRPWYVDEWGMTKDVRDGRPFSTDFSHTRFLVPHLAKKMGIKSGPVVFVDCDFMFYQPIENMLHAIDPTKVVSVVKHDTSRMQPGKKMDGMQQSLYARKLWSSLMVFNMGHPDIDRFDQRSANLLTGGELHGLIGLKDTEIGEIRKSWNYIPGLSWDLMHVDAVHWSMGGPWMQGFEKVRYASQWRKRYKEVVARELKHDNPTELFAKS